MRRFTAKAALWGGMATVAIAMGLLIWDATVVALGMVAAVFLLVAYLRRTPSVEVARSPSRLRVLEGDAFEMGLRVGSRGAWADVVEVFDQLPGYMRLRHGSNHQVLPLYKGEARDVRYSLECPLRGAYRIGPVHVRATDAPELFEGELLLQDVHQLDVYPVWVELRQLDLVSRALKYNMGPVTVNEPGRSTDFYSVRDYIKGDPYRKINWKKSVRFPKRLRHRKLMVNEDEKETLSDCAIFVDSRSLAASGTPLANFHETAVRTTMGLARTLVLNHNRVMVVTYNDAVNIVPPGISRGHIGIIQAMLVETVARGAVTFDWAVGYARPFLKPRSDIVVLSPMVSDMSFYPAILGLIRSGHRVVVVTSALEDYETRALKAPSPRAVMLQLQRSTNVDELASAGLPVIDIGADETLLSIMVRVSAALGGERLDIGALEEEEAPLAEGALPFEAAPPPEEGAPLLDDIVREGMGLRVGNRGVMALQLAAIASLVLAWEVSFLVEHDFWRTLCAAEGRPDYLTAGTFLMLSVEGVLLAWVASLLLGMVKVVRGRQARLDLGVLAYVVLAFLGLWYLVAVIFATPNSAADFYRFVRFVVIIVPFLGALSVMRRHWLGALVAVGLLAITLMLEPTPASDAPRAALVAIAAVLAIELAHAVRRFDGIADSLEGRADARGQGLFGSTLRRYALVVGATAVAAWAGTSALMGLPDWYVGQVGPGYPKALEATTVYMGVYLLGWLVALTLIGRWTALAIANMPQGRAVIEGARRRMVLRRPARPRPHRAGGPWEEEEPQPEAPPIPATP